MLTGLSLTLNFSCVVLIYFFSFLQEDLFYPTNQSQVSILHLFVSHFSLSHMNQIILFEEQEGDFKVHFEDTPDLGMAADIQWLITAGIDVFLYKID